MDSAYSTQAGGDMTNDVRKYGLGETKVSGAPRVTQTLEKGTGVFCPNCGCETLFEIEVDVESAGPLEIAGAGKYIGCPACPWASPCITVDCKSQPKAFLAKHAEKKLKELRKKAKEEK